MKVILLRSFKDCARVIENLSGDRNIEFFIEPLYEVRKKPAEEIGAQINIHISSGYDHLIITSMNAVSFLDFIGIQQKNALKSVIVVGEKIVDWLNSHQINAEVRSFSTALDLSQSLNSAQKYLHLSGARTTVNFAKFADVERIICYKALYKNAFSDDMINLLESDNPKLATFYSTQSAEVFCKLATGKKIRALNALAISKKVSLILQRELFETITVSDSPSGAGMIKKITEITHS
jgi:uroporphyrinogen-III synthase